MSVTGTLPRTVISQITTNPRAAAALESLSQAVDETVATAAQAVADTGAIQDATVLTLSANEAFTNERVFTPGSGLEAKDGDGRLTLSVDRTVPRVDGAYPVQFLTEALTRVFLPPGGTLATLSNRETLTNKTLQSPIVVGLGDYADDAAAAAGGVPVSGVYRTGSVLKVRVS